MHEVRIVAIHQGKQMWQEQYARNFNIKDRFNWKLLVVLWNPPE